LPADHHKLAFRGDIEGLRAVAVSLVVAGHAGVSWLDGGFIGVDVFFVLSGYLITALLLKELQSSERIDFAAFYARRFRRLAPGLIFMVAVSGLLAFLTLSVPAQVEQAVAGISALTWVSNFYFTFANLDYFASAADTNLFLHTWSLSAEEQFYLLWPWLLIALLGWKTHSSIRESRVGWLIIAMAAILFASLALCVLLTPRTPQFAFYMMPTRAWQFALGALGWFFVQGRIGTAAGAARTAVGMAGWAGLAAIFVAALWLTTRMAYPGMKALLPSMGAVAVIVAGSRGVGPVGLLSLKPLQFVGKLSYSWYLWHWPVLVLGRSLPVSASTGFQLALVGISFVLALLSFYCVEHPIRIRSRFLLRPLMMMLVIATAAMGGFQWYQLALDQKSATALVGLKSASSVLPPSSTCDSWYVNADVTPCFFYQQPQKSDHVVVLLGDSIGAQWYPAVYQTFNRPDWEGILLTKSACPIIDRAYFYKSIGRPYSECLAWQQKVFDYLAKLKPDIIIIGSAVSQGIDVQDWLDGTRSVLRKISGTAKHIYLLRPTPLLPFNGYHCLANESWVMKRFFPDHCQAPAVKSANDGIYRALQQAALEFANVSVVDMNEAVCPDDICRAKMNGYLVYGDSQHLSAAFVASLSAALAAQLGFDDSQIDATLNH